MGLSFELKVLCRLSNPFALRTPCLLVRRQHVVRRVVGAQRRQAGDELRLEDVDVVCVAVVVIMKRLVGSNVVRRDNHSCDERAVVTVGALRQRRGSRIAGSPPPRAPRRLPWSSPRASCGLRWHAAARAQGRERGPATTTNDSRKDAHLPSVDLSSVHLLDGCRGRQTRPRQPRSV